VGKARRKGVQRDHRVAGQRHSGQVWLIVGPTGRTHSWSAGDGPMPMDPLEARDAAWEDAEGRAPVDVDFDWRPIDVQREELALLARERFALVDGGEDATPVIPLPVRADVDEAA
jgi:hypothetical protein